VREVDTSALRLVARALGIGNPGTATGHVVFDDANLQQVLDVAPLARRGAGPPVQEGIWSIAFKHDHSAAPNATLTSTLQPYNMNASCAAGTSATGAAWPNPMPEGLDIWLLWSNAYLITGATANFGTALLDIVYPATSNAYSCNTALGTRSQQIHAYDGVQALVGASPILTLMGTGAIGGKIGMRLPRGSQIRWRTLNANDAAISVQTNITIGLFSAGLGQDGAF
jgi:hypothetical protein